MDLHFSNMQSSVVFNNASDVTRDHLPSGEPAERIRASEFFEKKKTFVNFLKKIFKCPINY